MAAGFDIKPTQSAICAVMLLRRQAVAGTSPPGCRTKAYSSRDSTIPSCRKARPIRVQVSAGHTTDQLDRCIAAFTKVGKELNVIK